MDGARNLYLGEERSIQGFGIKAWRNEKTGKT